MLKEQKTNTVVLGLMVILTVLLVTPTVKADLDLGWIDILYNEEYDDGIPEINHWEFSVFILWSDKGSLDHIDITLPDGSTVYTITAEDYSASYDSPTMYASLADLQADYPQGIYTLDFRDSSNTILRTVSLNFSDLPGLPVKPVDFTYPAMDGATGINTDPTFTWTVDASDGDFLTMWLNDEVTDESPYTSGPHPMTTTSWPPGPLKDGHLYELNVRVYKVKDGNGAVWPKMTVDGDMFSYTLGIGYENEIKFTTTGETPETMLARLALFIMDEVDSGNINKKLERSLLAKVNAAISALDKDNPNAAKVAKNNLKALINHVEAQTNKKITPEVAAEVIQQANAIIAILAG